VEPIVCVGQAFDPTRHQALVRQPTDEAPPMTVLAEAQKGYSLNGRTIRPAKVLVAVAPSAGEQPGPQVPEPPAGNGGAEA
jgi:molecular chaperone GrpE